MSRKLTITLILILFLLPFGSWYYLKSGLKWRQQAQTAMSGTTPVAGLPLITVDGHKLEVEQLAQHISMITVLDCHYTNEQRDLLRSLYRQFKETKKANFIFLDTCRINQYEWINELPSGVYVIPCDDSTRQCNPILSSWPPGKSYALVDKTGTIRSYYSADTKDEKRILLEHMALLIPREHGEKVELKRGENSQ